MAKGFLQLAVNLTAGSTAFVRTSGDYLVGVSLGDTITCGGLTAHIASIDTTTYAAGTLMIPWPGEDVAAGAAVVEQKFRDAIDLQARVSEMAWQLLQEGRFLPVDGEPAPSFGEVRQWAWNPSTLDVWLKTSATTWSPRPNLMLPPSTFPLSHRNRIINGSFRVNQRGVSGTVTLAAGAYGHDRWRAGASGCTYTFATSGADATLTITAGTLLQVIEGGDIEGGVYTASWSGTATARVYQGSASGTYAGSGFRTASLAGGVNATIEFASGTVTRVQLEPGEAVTGFERRGLADEQRRCMRYYEVLPVARLRGTSFGTNILVTADFAVPKRAAPAMSLLSTSAAEFHDGTSALSGTLTIAAQVVSTLSCYMQIGGLAANIGGSRSVVGWGTTAPFLAANAEL